MSKRGKQMDMHFQFWNIRRFLKNLYIQYDSIDYKALMDSSLYYPENEELIRNTIEGKYDRLQY